MINVRAPRAPQAATVSPAAPVRRPTFDRRHGGAWTTAAQRIREHSHLRWSLVSRLRWNSAATGRAVASG